MKIDKYMPVSHWMLKVARQYVIKHKAIFEKAIIAYAKILPEPTLDNTYRPNARRLIAHRDKFFGYFTWKGRKPLMEAAWKIYIDEVEHDAFYADLNDWLVEELKADDEWKERMALHPLPVYWSEPPKGDVNIVEIEMVVR